LKGYLLDTNHVTAWEKQATTFMEALSKIPDESVLRVCAITVGEIEAGHRINPTTNQARRDEFNAFVVRELHPYTIPLTLTTRIRYGEIMDRLWKKYRPPEGRRTELHLASSVGIDINDVWIVAVAWEHNLTLLTTDRMEKIRELVPEVQFENWWPDKSTKTTATVSTGP
jgi:tRNA(fMet)-specific endonuclease VapC